MMFFLEIMFWLVVLVAGVAIGTEIDIYIENKKQEYGEK